MWHNSHVTSILYCYVQLQLRCWCVLHHNKNYQTKLLNPVGNWKEEYNKGFFHCTWFLTCRTYLGSTECSFLSGCQQHGSPWALERLEPWSEPRSYACRWSFWGWGRSLPGSGCLHHALQTDKGRGNFVHTIPRNSKQNTSRYQSLLCSPNSCKSITEFDVFLWYLIWCLLTFCNVSFNWHMRVLYFNHRCNIAHCLMRAWWFFVAKKPDSLTQELHVFCSFLILAKFFICSIIATRTRNDFMSQNFFIPVKKIPK